MQAKQRFLKKQSPKFGKYWGGVLGCSALCGFEHFSSSCLSHACKFNACSPSPHHVCLACTMCSSATHVNITPPHPTPHVSYHRPCQKCAFSGHGFRSGGIYMHDIQIFSLYTHPYIHLPLHLWSPKILKLRPRQLRLAAPEMMRAASDVQTSFFMATQKN